MVPEGNMEGKGLSEKSKAFFLSVALGCFEEIKQSEPFGSVQRRRIVKAMEPCNTLIQHYKLDGFTTEEMKLAAQLVDEINERLKGMFS